MCVATVRNVELICGRILKNYLFNIFFVIMLDNLRRNEKYTISIIAIY